MARTNKQKREAYALIKKVTGSTELATANRGLLPETIASKYPDKLVVVNGELQKKKLPRTPKQELAYRRRLANQQFLYNTAVDAGYTAKEAQQMRNWSKSRFEKTLQDRAIVNVSSRRDKWARMAERENYPSNILDVVYEINEKNGFDINSKYGFYIVYQQYTEGNTLEFWENMTRVDPFNPNIYDDKR